MYRFRAIQFFNVFRPNLWDPLVGGENWWLLIPLTLGLMMFTRFYPKIAWISRWPLAYMVGIYSGLAVIGFTEGDLMRQVQQMRSQMQGVQEEANKEVIDVSAGGGMVKISINGALEVQSIEIDPEVADPDDVEMLQDLVLTATNEAIQKAQAMVATVAIRTTTPAPTPSMILCSRARPLA